MPRQKLNVEGRVGNESKIRKRGCSSSSSSSLVRNYRLKRAILVAKRVGSSTPVPIWKMERSPPCVLQNAKSMKYPPGMDLSASARKLAATLWEINDTSPQREENWEEGRSEKEVRSRERIGKASKSGSVQPHSCDPVHGRAAEVVDRSKAGDHRRRSLDIPQSGGLDSTHNTSIIEIETQSHCKTPSGNKVGVKSLKTRLKDVSNGLTASKELLKVLNRIWVQEEQRLSSIALTSALQFELDRARMLVEQLIQEERHNSHDTDYLVKRFAEEKAAWKSKERDRICKAITSVAGELEIEKKLKRQSERLNQKLGKELADTKASLSKVLKELQSEKRAREILEQACDELARGIEEDRAEVEEMKRESAKVREEVEKEREMLQIADVLREERVQMKLSEAKFEFEEKNAAVNKLKCELESYMKTKVGEENCYGSPNYHRIKELEEYLRKTLGASCQNGEKEHDEGEVVNGELDGEDSADSDLHSIELSMGNNSKNYNWSYSCGGATQNDSKRSSTDGKIKGRRSVSEKTQRHSICLGRETSDGIEWNFGTESQENSAGLDRGRLLELASQAWGKDYKEEIERYEMVRDLRDHILSGTRVVASSQGFACPN